MLRKVEKCCEWKKNVHEEIEQILKLSSSLPRKVGVVAVKKVCICRLKICTSSWLIKNKVNLILKRLEQRENEKMLNEKTIKCWQRNFDKLCTIIFDKNKSFLQIQFWIEMYIHLFWTVQRQYPNVRLDASLTNYKRTGLLLAYLAVKWSSRSKIFGYFSL